MVLLREKLEEYKSELCDDCRQRADTNPLRVFDCKTCVSVKEKLPTITDHLCEECNEHFEKLCAILKEMGVNFVLDPLLVRGLDYYTKTAYEIVCPELGAQNALCGGGRYDGLASELGGVSIPAVGFSAGMERLMQILPDALEEKEVALPRAYFVVFDDKCSIQAMVLADELRSAGFVAYIDFSMRSIKKQLKSASERGYDYAVFVGQKEIEDKEVTLKNMESGDQVTVSFEKLVSYFSEKGVVGIE
jgi:histidyl-tRNA synthetase